MIYFVVSHAEKRECIKFDYARDYKFQQNTCYQRLQAVRRIGAWLLAISYLVLIFVLLSDI